MKIQRLMALVVLSLATVPGARAATVWDGPTISFTKSNYANPLLAQNQDRLTANVWITRGSSQGLFNANTESHFTHYVSPAGTEWANGSLENYATLRYTNWNHWAAGVNPNPPATVGVQAVVHLIPDDIYLSVQFTSWSRGAPGGGPSYGGGFSYLRSTPVPETNTPPTVTITNPPNAAVFTAPASFSLEASASDPDGSVTNVQFFRDVTSLGNDSSSPYSASVSGLAAGNYTLSAVASDNHGLRATNSIVVTVAAPPPTTNTWTGADPSGYWSAPANWFPNGVPANGNDLVFPGGLPPGDMVSTNDLTDSFFRSIRFTQAGGHTIRGNPITLTNSTDVINHSGTNLIACDLTFTGTPPTQDREILGPFGSGELTVIGNVGGGSLRVAGGRLIISGQFTGGSLRVVVATLALYGDNPSVVSADVLGSKLLVQGSQPNLNITLSFEFETLTHSGLSGDGQVGDVTGSGTVVLDSTLSVKNMSASALSIRLNGTNVGEYGRLVASGDVSPSSGFLLPSAFNPQPGQVFTIVEKTSPGAITNAPFGPEGTVTTLNGMPFRISYVGGDGNDVTLTATLPRLDIARTNPAQVRLSWPTNYPGFNLQRASAIDGPAPWSNHPMSRVVMGSNYTVTQPAATNREFFRLKQP